MNPCTTIIEQITQRTTIHEKTPLTLFKRGNHCLIIVIILAFRGVTVLQRPREFLESLYISEQIIVGSKQDQLVSSHYRPQRKYSLLYIFLRINNLIRLEAMSSFLKEEIVVHRCERLKLKANWFAMRADRNNCRWFATKAITLFPSSKLIWFRTRDETWRRCNLQLTFIWLFAKKWYPLIG